MSGPVPNPWVDLRQVTVRYGRVQALDHVTLRIVPGERVEGAVPGMAVGVAA